jgi:hypothetical protein
VGADEGPAGVVAMESVIRVNIIIPSEGLIGYSTFEGRHDLKTYSFLEKGFDWSLVPKSSSVCNETFAPGHESIFIHFSPLPDFASTRT